MPALKHYEEEALKDVFVVNNSTILGLSKDVLDRITNETTGQIMDTGLNNDVSDCFINFLTQLSEAKFIALINELHNTRRQQLNLFLDIDIESINPVIVQECLARISSIYSVNKIEFTNGGFASERLIFTIIDYCGNTKEEIIKFLVDIGLNHEFRGTKDKIKHEIASYLFLNQKEVNKYGELVIWNALEDLVPKALNEVKNKDRLLKDLALSGLEYKNHKLIRLSNSNINVVEKNDYIEKVLTQRTFTTTLGHYQSVVNEIFTDATAAMGQLRTFFESLFNDIARHIKSVEPSNPIQLINPQKFENSRQIISKCLKPLFTNPNELDDQGNGFINGVWKKLSMKGSHPGIPDKREALYRYELVMIVSADILERFEKQYP